MAKVFSMSNVSSEFSFFLFAHSIAFNNACCLLVRSFRRAFLLFSQVAVGGSECKTPTQSKPYPRGGYQLPKGRRTAMQEVGLDPSARYERTRNPPFCRGVLGSKEVADRYFVNYSRVNSVIETMAGLLHRALRPALALALQLASLS